jgi:hypothetical protein
MKVLPSFGERDGDTLWLYRQNEEKLESAEAFAAERNFKKKKALPKPKQN